VSQSYAIFCSNPLEPRTAEPDFAADVAAARDAGFAIALVDHDELERYRRPKAALRKARFGEGGPAVYRGWMLRAEAYGPGGSRSSIEVTVARTDTTQLERGYTGQRGQDEQNRRARKAAVQTPGKALTRSTLNAGSNGGFTVQ